MSRSPGFLEELKRRRVVRAGLVYALVAFGVAQVADLLFPALLLPDWTVRFVVALLLIGFPVALVLAWSFDLTPDGVRRTPRQAGTGEAAVAGETGEREPGTAATPAGGSTGEGRLSLGTPRATGLVGLGMLIALIAFGGYHFLGAPGEPDGTAEADADARHSIAVLPFTTMAGGEENEYFADGLTEDILTNLGLVPDFTVVSRTSVMRYKGSDRSVPEIAAELGVRYVLEGSMRRAGDQVRVVIQLIEPGTDRQIWARTMDRRIEDVFVLQSEIAHAVVDALRVELGAGVGERIGRAPTGDMAAYDLFLQGRDFYYQYSRSAMVQAIDRFDRAVARDPEFALALAWLAAAKAVCVFNYGCDTTLLDESLADARRAVELQPDLSDGHRALGLVLTTTGRLEAGAPPLERAVELNPNDFPAMSNLGLNQSLRGRMDDAIATTYRSIERDPARSFIDYSNLSQYYRILGLNERARRTADQAFALRFNDVNAAASLALVDVADGRTDAAVARMEELKGEITDPAALATTAHVLILAGRSDLARPHLERAYEAAPDMPPLGLLHSPAILFAWVLQQDGELDRAAAVMDSAERDVAARVAAGAEIATFSFALAAATTVRGEMDAAAEHFERAVARGLMDPVVIERDPVLAPLRAHPRFQAAMERMWERQRAQRERAEQIPPV